MLKHKKTIALFLTISLLFCGCGNIDSNTKVKEKKSEDLYTAKLTTEKKYNDGEHIIEFMGLKEYKEIKTDMYTDTPKKGKIFLVLFLRCSNGGEENLYINEASLESMIDGKICEHSILLNDPEGYPTFFRNFTTADKDFGFLVWETSPKWEKLDITYHGFEGTNQNLLKMEFTKKDLKDPEAYEKVVPH